MIDVLYVALLTLMLLIGAVAVVGEARSWLEVRRARAELQEGDDYRRTYGREADHSRAIQAAHAQGLTGGSEPIPSEATGSNAPEEPS